MGGSSPDAPDGERDGLPDNVVPLSDGWRSRLFRGLRAAEEGEREQAFRWFEAALALERRPEVLYALGREHLRAGRPDVAEPLLREAWGGGKGLVVAAASLARLLGVGFGRTEEAHELLEEAVALYPDEPNLLIVRGEVHLEGDDPEAARRCFEAALAQGGDVDAGRSGLARALNAVGIERGEAGDDDQALFAFRRAAELDPDWAGPLVNIGVVFSRLERPSRAEEAYESALRIDPKNPIALYNLGTLRRARGETRGARQAFETVLAVDPDHIGVRSALADLLGEEGRFDRALVLLEEDLARNPGSARCWANLGLAQACLGEDGAAERSLRRALEIDPEHASACFHLSTLLDRTGRTAEAAEWAGRARALDPKRAAVWFGERST